MIDEKQNYAVKAFREDGTPTSNPRRYFVSKDKALQTAKEISEAMTGGWVQLEVFDDRPDFGFWVVDQVFESARKPRNSRQAAADNAALRQMGT